MLFISWICPALASGWYSENLPPNREITMVDLRWPHWPAGTYFAFWNGSFYPEGGSFYGGLVSAPPAPETDLAAQTDYHPNLIWAFWWGKAYGEDVVRNTSVGPTMSPRGYGGEGVSAGLNGGGNVEWMRAGDWYRMLMRVWNASDDSTESFVGWWAKDLSSGTWRLLGTFSVPCRVTGLKGHSAFVEFLSKNHTSQRILERRLGYCRVEGQWLQSNSMTVKADATHVWHASLVENDTVARFIHTKDPNGPSNVPAGQSMTITTKQPDQPLLDAPEVKDVTASSWGNQITVRWDVPASAAPQLGYRIEAFTGSDATGRLVGTTESWLPHVRADRLDASAKVASVRLTVIDLFDQSASVVVPATTATPVKPAATPASARPGLAYAYFEPAEGVVWTRIPDVSSLEPVRQGVVRELDLSVRGDRPDHCALRYHGLLKVPESGLYVFDLASSDGSRIRINDQVVADDDGRHGPAARRHPVALAEGSHRFEIDYFAYDPARKGRHTSLQVKWAGPGFAYRDLQRDDFNVIVPPDTPTIELPLPAAGPELADNLLDLRADVTAHGHAVTRVEFFRGAHRLWDAKEDDHALTALLPEGENPLWARMWYDDGNASVDSGVRVFRTRNRTSEPWSFDPLGETNLPLGIRCKDGRFEFVGEGVCFASQPVTGDFTLTARVAEIANSSPDSGIHPHSWVGLFLKQKIDRPFSWFHGIYRTVGAGVRGSPDFRDLGARRITNHPLGGDDRWLRVVRNGTTLGTFTSPDGEDWRPATEEIHRSLQKNLHAGLIFRTIPHENKTLFYGALDEVSLEPGRVFDAARTRPRSEDLPRDGRITAVVQGVDRPEFLYARSRGAGVLRSDDHGRSWSPANGGTSTPASLAVRSLAVHPEDASTILRGTGTAVDGTLVSGLWKSTDGGAEWRLLSEEIDFDGGGPSAIFGETISFNPRDPRMVAAAGETSGIHLSRDAGETWEPVGLQGERITCLAFSPYKAGLLVVGTCSEDEFQALGFDRPAAAAPNSEAGRIYYIHCGDGRPSPRLRCERKSFGVVNLAFRPRIGLTLFGTTRGLYATWGNAQTFYQRLQDPGRGELLIAMTGMRHNDEAIYAAPFSTRVAAPVCSVGRTGRGWNQLVKEPLVRGGDSDTKLNAGITCLLEDRSDAGTLYLCNRHGIFVSRDKGKSYDLVHPVRGE